ncbi:MAG: hypothetical protein Q9175_002669 [Cornicularia normoerica]
MQGETALNRIVSKTRPRRAVESVGKDPEGNTMELLVRDYAARILKGSSDREPRSTVIMDKWTNPAKAILLRDD